MKKCVYCAEEIQQEAILCKYCGKNQASPNNFIKHLNILGCLYLAFSILMLIGALAAKTLLPMVGGFTGDIEAMGILSTIGWGISTFLIIMATPGLICGYGLITKKSWSRILGIILSCLSLLSIPFGTIIGVYGLWVLFQDQTIYILNNNQNISSEHIENK